MAAVAQGTRRDGSQRFLRERHFQRTPEQNSGDLYLGSMSFQDRGVQPGHCQGLEPPKSPKCCEGSSGIVLILGMNLNS